MDTAASSSRRVPRRRAAVLLLLALGAAGVPALVAPVERAAASTRSAVRLSGEDRYLTAVSISRTAFPDGSDSAVVVSGASFPDGLAAGPLAALLGGPVLLTGTSALHEATAGELSRLGAGDVVVVGGPAAVTEEVVAEIAALTGVSPRRIAGVDRYDTAAAVATEFGATASPVFAASGAAFPDALAGGAAAAASRTPLLLVTPDEVPTRAARELRRLAPEELVVLGGSTAVGDPVLEQLQALVPATRRIAGDDRWSTAAALAAERGGAAHAILATGESFPDALAAAPLASTLGAPILLSPVGCAPQPTVDLLRAWSWPDITAVGGPAALSPAAVSIVPCHGVPDGDVAPGIRVDTLVLPGPRVARIATIDRQQGMEIRVVPASGRVTGRVPVTDIARRWDAPLAVNAGFFHGNGEPVHALASVGRLLKAPGQLATIVGFDVATPLSGYFGRPDLAMAVEIDGSDEHLAVQRVNSGIPTQPDEVSLFTAEDPRPVPTDADLCRATLQPAGHPGLADNGDTVQAHVVQSVACHTGTVIVSGDVLVAHVGTDVAARLAALDPGAGVRFRWRAHTSEPGMLDVAGANISLVHGGAVSTDVLHNGGPFFTERAPRTAIARLADGRLLIVVVDGRRSGYSVGMTPRELADFLIDRGAVDAVNLDGGGSSAMAVDGVLATRPSDRAGERSVGSAVILLPSSFRASSAAAGGAALPAPVAPVPGVDPATDAASIGGWAESERRQGRPLSPALARDADTFRRSR